MNTQGGLFGLNLKAWRGVSELLTYKEQMWHCKYVNAQWKLRSICEICYVSAYILIDFMFFFYSKINQILYEILYLDVLFICLII